jgi:hypothetical protein
VARYEGPTGIIATLELTERNLLCQLDPEAHDAWMKGGVYPVG